MNRNNRLKSFFAASSATVMAVATFAPVASAAAMTDVPEDSNYYNAVLFLSSKYNVGYPDGTFKPHQQITRADAAVLLAKVLELDINRAPASGFKDVPPRAVKYINALKEMGIVKGKNADTFGSQAFITRGELALWFERTFEIFEIEQSGSSLPFTDVSKVYVDAVKLLVENGVTSGKTTSTFGTTANATRGEFAIFLHRASNVWRTASINKSGEGNSMQLFPSGAFGIVYGPKSGTRTINGELLMQGDAIVTVKGEGTISKIIGSKAKEVIWN